MLLVFLFTVGEVYLGLGDVFHFSGAGLNGVFLFIAREIWVFVGVLRAVLYTSRWGGVDEGFRGVMRDFEEGVRVALFSSSLLLASGVTLTVFHSRRRAGSPWLLVTIVLGLVFCVTIWEEWFNRGLDWESGSGRLFYITTGLHGTHVLLGLVLLGVLMGVLGLWGSRFIGLGVIEGVVWY